VKTKAPNLAIIEPANVQAEPLTSLSPRDAVFAMIKYEFGGFYSFLFDFLITIKLLNFQKSGI
jgi:hypothetical protein